MHLHLSHAVLLYGGAGNLVLGVSLMSVHALRTARAARREFRRYIIRNEARRTLPDLPRVPADSFRPTEPLRRYEARRHG